MPDPFIHDGDHGNDNDKVDKNENIIDIDIDIDEDVIDDGSGDSGDDDGENSDEGDAGHYVSAHRKKAHARHDKGSSQRRREYLRSENDRADDDVPSEFPLIISAQSRDFVVIGPSLDMHVHNVSTALDAGMYTGRGVEAVFLSVLLMSVLLIIVPFW